MSDRPDAPYDEYGCLREHLESRIAADLKCTMPFLGYNGVNSHLNLCNNHSGCKFYKETILVIASKTDFAEAYNKMWYLIEEELQLYPACSPKCERKIYKGVVDYGSKNGKELLSCF